MTLPGDEEVSDVVATDASSSSSRRRRLGLHLYLQVGLRRRARFQSSTDSAIDVSFKITAAATSPAAVEASFGK